MEYIREGNVIPAPFNILLIPVFILQGVGAIINYVRKKPKKTQQTDLPMSRRPNHQTKQMNGEAKVILATDLNRLEIFNSNLIIEIRKKIFNSK